MCENAASGLEMSLYRVGSTRPRSRAESSPMKSARIEQKLSIAAEKSQANQTLNRKKEGRKKAPRDSDCQLLPLSFNYSLICGRVTLCETSTIEREIFYFLPPKNSSVGVLLAKNFCSTKLIVPIDDRWICERQWRSVLTLPLMASLDFLFHVDPRHPLTKVAPHEPDRSINLFFFEKRPKKLYLIY